MLLVRKFRIKPAVALGQPFVGQVHGDAAGQGFSRQDFLPARTIVQACHSVLGLHIQTAQADRGIGSFRLVAKNVDDRLGGILFNVLNGTPSRSSKFWMVDILEQQMAVLLEEQQVALEGLHVARRSSGEELRGHAIDIAERDSMCKVFAQVIIEGRSAIPATCQSVCSRVAYSPSCE